MVISKTSYLSPLYGDITVHSIHRSTPELRVELDLGIPKIGQCTISLAIPDGGTEEIAGVVMSAVHALLDKLTTDMLSLSFSDPTCVDLNASVLASLASNKTKLLEEKGASVTSIRWKFPIPESFMVEAQHKVITASVVKRLPNGSRYKLPSSPARKPSVQDVRKSIDLYRERAIRSAPRPLYLMLYDQRGRVQSVLNVDRMMQNKLFKAVR